MSSSAVDSFAEANKTHFDKVAHEYDEMPHATERGRRSAEALRNAYPFDEQTTSVMEYACGTGLVSRELAPYSKRIVGVDISQGMVDQFNKRVANQGISPDEMQAFCVELKGQAGELNDEKFDVIVCTSAYHHFESIQNVTNMLAYFLKPGGYLLVVDLLKGYSHHQHDHHKEHGHGHNHDHGTGHGHKEGAGEESDNTIFPKSVHHVVPHVGGLDEEDMRKTFEGAGLGSFTFKVVIDAMKDGKEVKLFLAKGVKPIV
ncbi:S-adenosyl-L-methionine-dependent methyltransferase [Collybia nuda]|uniref:S-adenosyl-L-methionine-dependent methyltransferase n=1 Tax=Collybia nuda TaxID=64659 RepID=A0A9P5Y6R2_9AGAR|nr:S-adenosyl-L-methionine-dependent methyltransferase [Collybia nuda]